MSSVFYPQSREGENILSMSSVYKEYFNATGFDSLWKRFVFIIVKCAYPYVGVSVRQCVQKRSAVSKHTQQTHMEYAIKLSNLLDLLISLVIFFSHITNFSHIGFSLVIFFVWGFPTSELFLFLSVTS